MPYKKRRVYRKKPKSSNAKIWKEINHLKRVAGAPEYKKRDISYTTQNVDNTGTIYPLTLVPEGDQNDERTGNRTTPQYVQLKLAMYGYINTAGAEPPQFVRCIIFRWRDRDGALPAVSGLLQNVNYNSFYNVINSGGKKDRKFDILMDKMYDLGSGEGALDKRTRLIHKNFRLSPKSQVSYADPGATATSLALNHIYMLMISNVSGNEPQFEGYSRYTFIDG